MAKVTGLGGVFFKSKDPAASREWYRKNLGVESEQWGTMFKWRSFDDPEKNVILFFPSSKRIQNTLNLPRFPL